MKMSVSELKEIIRLHQLWLNGDPDGKRANLGEADLSGADLRWSDLGEANLGEADLSGADLGEADLSGADLRWSDLGEANLGGANLRWANLRGANLREANLSGANLRWANLRGANLRGANVDSVPVVENLDAKILAAISNGKPRLGVCDLPSLEMSSWHSCGTAHCRAGWAITLAGKEGADLESRVGSCAAGELIYFKSTGAVPNFYTDNETALASIQEAAKGQVAEATP